MKGDCYPLPDNFKSGPPTSGNKEDPLPMMEGWPPKGNLQSADEEVGEAVWNIPDGRRKGK